MPAPALQCVDLTKRFGPVTAVDGLNLEIPAGSVFGFLGPNGAGKTTTIRMLVGLARPTSGSALILGEEVRSGLPGRYQRLIGFLPDSPAFYNWMRAEEFLRLTGELFGLGGAELSARVRDTLDLVGLAGIRTRVGGFSRGMKQRLGIAQALINAPRVLFLDEPTSALDPLGRKEVLDIIGRLAGETTIFFSTHILGDVERVCDRAAILDKGRLVVEETIEKLRTRFVQSAILVEIEGGPEALRTLLSQHDWVEKVERPQPDAREALVTVKDLRAAQQLLPRIIGESGLALVRFETVESSLEDIFVGLVGKK